MFGGYGIPELTVAVIVILLVSTVLYFLPTFIAVQRHKANIAPIALVNFLLGWTVIGWIVAIVWALSTQVADQENTGASAASQLCAQCGKYSQGGSRFCAHCGATLATAAEGPTVRDPQM